jgi:ketosteroid isomerase-like protein
MRGAMTAFNRGDGGAFDRCLAHFREGRITRFQTFADRGQALEAAGLRE